MSFDDAELMKEFVVESQEHLADVENQLLTLESQGDSMDVGLVNKVFRAVHSIKGAAGFMGLETLGGLAHRAEEVLNKLRTNELRPTSLVINTLLRAADQLKALLDQIETSNQMDVTPHLVALQSIMAGEEAATTTAVAIEPTSENTKFEIGISSEALREFLIESFDNLEQAERDLLALERQPGADDLLNSVFRSIHTIKGSAGFLGYLKAEKLTHAAESVLGSIRSGNFPFDESVSERMFTTIDAVRRILHSIESEGHEGADVTGELATQMEEFLQEKLSETPTKVPKRGRSTRKSASSKKAPVAAVTSSKEPTESVEARRAQPDPEVIVTPVKPTPVQANSPKIETAQAPEAAPKAPTPTRISPAPAGSASGSTESSASDSTIRVDVALLDKLMTRVGELVLARNQILQFNSTIDDSALHSAMQRLNLITTELQEGVMKTRMQPIGSVWSKFPRLVRDLATMCEKDVRIEMEGKETELDKTIIEAIKDPLTHLVRNTVDHGIERPEVRAQNGKPTEGCLILRAYHEGGQVNIEICDDGAGLNLGRIKAKAVEKGLMTLEQVARLADRDVGNLIFLPGFSTAEKVSNVSGRGVGMDVVKTNIEKIGGTVDLQSKPGLGTTIKIKIPLTLAIIPALIITSDSDRYAIPQVNLMELVRLEGEESRTSIEWIQGAPVYRLRGRLLPLVYLRNELGIPRDNSAKSEIVNIVVLRADDRQFGLVVDNINDSEEIVVKPLSKQLKNVSVYSGTTIMGDGRVALILDVMGLAQSAHVVTGTKERAVSDSNDRATTNNSNMQTLLVLGVGPSRRFALPIAQVTRLEKLAINKVERADHQEVVQYRGEILPLIRLSDTLGVEPANHPEGLMDVVVYSEDGRSVGLVVDQIVDIVETELINTRPAQRAGLTQSAVINGHVTDLLDLPAVIRMVDPSFFQSTLNV
ncbi:MAG: chemotaxis protein CheW [Planctomycetota bacterium]|nr:chemotaxis protein CheW [Planctomycetota bacterium]